MSGQESRSRSGAGKPFLTSNEVVDRLGISKSTLYAYVSRGLIRSEPDLESPRSRRYRADDVERLLNRQRMRSDPDQTAASALDWGTPILESDISTISDERLSYRGMDALGLAQDWSFERVAALLWERQPDSALPEPDESTAPIRHELLQQSKALAHSVPPLGRMQMLLPVWEHRDPASYDFRPETLHRAGAGVLQMFTAVLVGTEGRSGIARTLQANWSPGNSEYTRLIDAALILCADHELNISTFTVRCIASARAPVYSAISGGISAMRGYKHGGATLQTEALVEEIDSPGAALDVLRNRLQRGEKLPGFGHRLYLSGDPRGDLLLELLRETPAASEIAALADAICDAADQLQGLKPNIDFGLVMLSRLFEQPRGTALSLMALGRIAGWIAHAQEEYDRDRLIRPRASQVGAETQSD